MTRLQRLRAALDKVSALPEPPPEILARLAAELAQEAAKARQRGATTDGAVAAAQRRLGRRVAGHAQPA